MSDIRSSGSEPLEGRDSVVEHLRKDWIIQFKGRRSLFSGGGSKSPELLPKLRLSDLGHKCSAPVQATRTRLCALGASWTQQDPAEHSGPWGAVWGADSGHRDLMVALGATWFQVPSTPLPQVPLLCSSMCSPCVPSSSRRAGETRVQVDESKGRQKLPHLPQWYI